MQDKIKARLKEKFPGVNLSQTRIDAIADKLSSKITDENEIDTKLDELNDVHPLSEIAKYDDWQRSKQQKKPAQQQQQSQSSTDPNDEPDLKSMFAELQKEINNLKTERQRQSLQEQLVKKAAEKKIPAVLLKGRVVESEDQLDSVLAELEADHNDYKQALNNEGFKQASPPAGGSGGKQTDKQVLNAIDAWASKDKQ